LKGIKLAIRELPFILLLIDLIWWVLSFWDIWISEFWFVGEIFSHSLAFTGFMAFYAYIHKYCLYSWICIIGLAFLNLVNIAHYFLSLKYIEAYAGIIILTSLIFSIIKWKQAHS